MAGVSGTEVLYQRENRMGVTTLTFRRKRYQFPSVVVNNDTPHGVDGSHGPSEGACVMMDVGMFCPHCAGAVQAQLSGSQTRLEISRRSSGHQADVIRGQVGGGALPHMPQIALSPQPLHNVGTGGGAGSESSGDHPHTLPRAAQRTPHPKTGFAFDDTFANLTHSKGETTSHTLFNSSRGGYQRHFVDNQVLNVSVQHCDSGSQHRPHRHHSLAPLVESQPHIETVEVPTESPVDTSELQDISDKLVSSDYESLGHGSQDSSTLTSTDTCIFIGSSSLSQNDSTTSSTLNPSTRYHSLENTNTNDLKTTKQSRRFSDHSDKYFLHKTSSSSSGISPASSKHRSAEQIHETLVCDVFNNIQSSSVSEEELIDELLHDEDVTSDSVDSSFLDSLQSCPDAFEEENTLEEDSKTTAPPTTQQLTFKQECPSQLESKEDLAQLDEIYKQMLDVVNSASHVESNADCCDGPSGWSGRSVSPEFMVDEILENISGSETFRGDATLKRVFSLDTDQTGHYPSIHKSSSKKKQKQHTLATSCCSISGEGERLQRGRSIEETLDINLNNDIVKSEVSRLRVMDRELSPEDIFEQVVENLSDMDEWTSDYESDHNEIIPTEIYDHKDSLGIMEFGHKTATSSCECIAEGRSAVSELSLDLMSAMSSSESSVDQDTSMDEYVSSRESIGNLLITTEDHSEINFKKLISETRTLTDNLMATFQEGVKQDDDKNEFYLPDGKAESEIFAEHLGVCLLETGNMYSDPPSTSTKICPPQVPEKPAQYAKISKLPTEYCSSNDNVQCHSNLPGDTSADVSSCSIVFEPPSFEMNLANIDGGDSGNLSDDLEDIDKVFFKNVDHASTSDLEEAYNDAVNNKTKTEEAISWKHETHLNVQHRIPPKHVQKLTEFTSDLDVVVPAPISSSSSDNESDLDENMVAEFRKCMETQTSGIDEHVPEIVEPLAQPDVLIQAFETAKIVASLIGKEHVKHKDKHVASGENEHIHIRDETVPKLTSIQSTSFDQKLQSDKWTDLVSEADTRVANFETKEDFSKQQAQQFIKYMLGDSEHIHGGSHGDVSACLEEVCQSCAHKPTEEEVVKTETVTTQEMTLVFAWPKKKSAQVHIGPNPFREVHLHRVTRLTDFDVELVESPTVETYEYGKPIANVHMHSLPTSAKPAIKENNDTAVTTQNITGQTLTTSCVSTCVSVKEDQCEIPVATAKPDGDSELKTSAYSTPRLVSAENACVNRLSSDHHDFPQMIDGKCEKDTVTCTHGNHVVMQWDDVTVSEKAPLPSVSRVCLSDHVKVKEVDKTVVIVDQYSSETNLLATTSLAENTTRLIVSDNNISTKPVTMPKCMTVDIHDSDLSNVKPGSPMEQIKIDFDSNSSIGTVTSLCSYPVVTHTAHEITTDEMTGGKIRYGVQNVVEMSPHQMELKSNQLDGRGNVSASVERDIPGNDSYQVNQPTLLELETHIKTTDSNTLDQFIFEAPIVEAKKRSHPILPIIESVPVDDKREMVEEDEAFEWTQDDIYINPVCPEDMNKLENKTNDNNTESVMKTKQTTVIYEKREQIVKENVTCEMIGADQPMNSKYDKVKDGPESNQDVSQEESTSSSSSSSSPSISSSSSSSLSSEECVSASDELDADEIYTKSSTVTGSADIKIVITDTDSVNPPDIHAYDASPNVARSEEEYGHNVLYEEKIVGVQSYKSVEHSSDSDDNKDGHCHIHTKWQSEEDCVDTVYFLHEENAVQTMQGIKDLEAIGHTEFHINGRDTSNSTPVDDMSGYETGCNIIYSELLGNATALPSKNVDSIAESQMNFEEAQPMKVELYSPVGISDTMYLVKSDLPEPQFETIPTPGSVEAEKFSDDGDDEASEGSDLEDLLGDINASGSFVHSRDVGGPKHIKATHSHIGKLLDTNHLTYDKKSKSETDITRLEKSEYNFRTQYSANVPNEPWKPQSFTMQNIVSTRKCTSNNNSNQYLYRTEYPFPPSRSSTFKNVSKYQSRSVVELNVGKYFGIPRTSSEESLLSLPSKPPEHHSSRPTQKSEVPTSPTQLCQFNNNSHVFSPMSSTFKARSLTVPNIKDMILHARVETRKSLSSLETVAEDEQNLELCSALKDRCANLEKEIEKRLLELSQMADQFAKQGTISHREKEDRLRHIDTLREKARTYLDINVTGGTLSDTYHQRQEFITNVYDATTDLRDVCIRKTSEMGIHHELSATDSVQCVEHDQSASGIDLIDSLEHDKDIAYKHKVSANELNIATLESKEFLNELLENIFMNIRHELALTTVHECSYVHNNPQCAYQPNVEIYHQSQENHQQISRSESEAPSDNHSAYNDFATHFIAALFDEVHMSIKCKTDQTNSMSTESDNISEDTVIQESLVIAPNLKRDGTDNSEILNEDIQVELFRHGVDQQYTINMEPLQHPSDAESHSVAPDKHLKAETSTVSQSVFQEILDPGDDLLSSDEHNTSKTSILSSDIGSCDAYSLDTAVSPLESLDGSIKEYIQTSMETYPRDPFSAIKQKKRETEQMSICSTDSAAELREIWETSTCKEKILIVTPPPHDQYSEECDYYFEHIERLESNLNRTHTESSGKNSSSEYLTHSGVSTDCPPTVSQLRDSEREIDESLCITTDIIAHTFQMDTIVIDDITHEGVTNACIQTEGEESISTEKETLYGDCLSIDDNDTSNIKGKLIQVSTGSYSSVGLSADAQYDNIVKPSGVCTLDGVMLQMMFESESIDSIQNFDQYVKKDDTPESFDEESQIAENNNIDTTSYEGVLLSESAFRKHEVSQSYGSLISSITQTIGEKYENTLEEQYEQNQYTELDKEKESAVKISMDEITFLKETAIIVPNNDGHMSGAVSGGECHSVVPSSRTQSLIHEAVHLTQRVEAFLQANKKRQIDEGPWDIYQELPRYKSVESRNIRHSAPLLLSFENIACGRSRPRSRQSKTMKFKFRSSSLPTIREGSTLPIGSRQISMDVAPIISRSMLASASIAKVKKMKEGGNKTAALEKLHSMKDEFECMLDAVQSVRERCSTEHTKSSRRRSSVLEDIYQVRDPLVAQCSASALSGARSRSWPSRMVDYSVDSADSDAEANTSGGWGNRGRSSCRGGARARDQKPQTQKRFQFQVIQLEGIKPNRAQSEPALLVSPAFTLPQQQPTPPTHHSTIGQDHITRNRSVLTSRSRSFDRDTSNTVMEWLNPQRRAQSAENVPRVSVDVDNLLLSSFTTASSSSASSRPDPSEPLPITVQGGVIMGREDGGPYGAEAEIPLRPGLVSTSPSVKRRRVKRYRSKFYKKYCI